MNNTTSIDLGTDLTEDDIIALGYSRLAYFALGLNIGLIAHGIVSSFRVFKQKRDKSFIICIWGLCAGFISTLLSYGSGYWAATEYDSKVLTTFDGIFYPQMFLSTFFAYYLRLTSLSTFPQADKYLKMIPIIAILQVTIDVILYIYSAWVPEDLNGASALQVDGAWSGCVVLITFLTYYLVLLKKMFGFLTVSKKSLLVKVTAIVMVLFVVDIMLIVSNFVDVGMYNAIYGLSFTIKLVCVIEFFDESSWM